MTPISEETNVKDVPLLDRIRRRYLGDMYDVCTLACTPIGLNCRQDPDSLAELEFRQAVIPFDLLY